MLQQERNPRFTVVISGFASSGCFTATSATSPNTVIAVTSLVTPVVSIAANPGNTICSLQPVTFAATPVNGGTVPSYQWKKNGSNVGVNSPSYNPSSLANGDIISCVLTSNAGCITTPTATSNDITMAVTTAIPVPTASITGQRIFVSAGHYNGQYTMTIPSGILSYTIDWYQKLNNVWIFKTTTSTNNWVHNPIDNATPDTIQAILKPVGGCYSPDSSVSNTVILTSGVGVAALTMPSGFHIYPNPLSTNNMLTIEGLHKGDYLSLYNLLGQQLWHWVMEYDNRETVRLPALAEGMYLVRFITPKGMTGEQKIRK